MDRNARVVAQFNNQNAELEFNETFVMVTSVCTVIIDFRGKKIFDNAVLKLIFTDDIPQGNKGGDVVLSFDNNNETVVLTHYQWYGMGIESTLPTRVANNEKKQEWNIKLSTTAYRDLNRRKINLSIWRIIT